MLIKQWRFYGNKKIAFVIRNQQSQYKLFTHPFALHSYSKSPVNDLQ